MIVNHYLKPFSIFTTILFTMALVILNLYIPYENASDSTGQPLAGKLISGIVVNKWVSAGILFIIANIIAFFSYIINDKFVILNQRSYFPYFIAGTLIVAGPYMQTISPTHFSFVFVFISLFIILSIHDGKSNQYNLINASFILAVGSFIQFQILYFLPVLWIAAGIQKSLNFRSFQASIMGVVFPYLLVSGLYYVFDSVEAFLDPIVASVKLQGYQFSQIPEGFWPLFIGVALLVFIGFVSFLRYRERLNTVSRRSMEIFIVFMMANFLYYMLGLLPLRSSLIFGSLSAGIILSGLWIRIGNKGKRLILYSYLLLLLVSYILKF